MPLAVHQGGRVPTEKLSRRNPDPTWKVKEFKCAEIHIWEIVGSKMEELVDASECL